jgi:hypothetical protein
MQKPRIDRKGSQPAPLSVDFFDLSHKKHVRNLNSTADLVKVATESSLR